MSMWKRFRIMMRSILISYGITLLLFAIYAFLLAKTNLSEKSITTFTTVFMLISVFMGSSLAVGQIQEKGLLNGALVGIIYVMLLYTLSSIFATGFSMGSQTMGMILYIVFAGMVGGVVGVNFIAKAKNKNSSR